MTKQEYLQLISDKIDAGKSFPAIDSEKWCFYGQENSDKECFIGILIPKNHPAKKFPGSIGRLLQRYPEVQQFMPEGVSIEQLTQCQVTHDSYTRICVGAESEEKCFQENKEYILEELKAILEI